MELLSLIALTVQIANSTSTESDLAAATWQLVFETRLLWIMTALSGAAVAGVAAYLGLNQRSMQNALRKAQAMTQIRDLIEDPNIASFMQNMRTYKEQWTLKGEKAIYSNDEGLHQMLGRLTDAILDQAQVVEGRFEDASVIVNKKLVDFGEFANRYRPKFLEYWGLLEDDILYKRKSHPKLCINFEKVVQRLRKE